VIAVADAGPLMALAKIKSLDLLSRLYAPVYLTPNVYAETVIAGYAMNAADADLIEQAVARGQILQRTPISTTLPAEVLMHSGERESLCLALEIQADSLLIDDLGARRAAENILITAGARTRVKGTLGIIVTAYQQQLLTREAALERVLELRARPDIWLNAELCDRVIVLLRTS